VERDGRERVCVRDREGSAPDLFLTLMHKLTATRASKTINCLVDEITRLEERGQRDKDRESRRNRMKSEFTLHSHFKLLKEANERIAASPGKALTMPLWRETRSTSLPAFAKG
jgi:hypothetical protein